MLLKRILSFFERGTSDSDRNIISSRFLLPDSVGSCYIDCLGVEITPFASLASISPDRAMSPKESLSFVVCYLLVKSSILVSFLFGSFIGINKSATHPQIKATNLTADLQPTASSSI